METVILENAENLVSENLAVENLVVENLDVIAEIVEKPVCESNISRSLEIENKNEVKQIIIVTEPTNTVVQDSQLFSTKLIHQKSIDIVIITQITFKQVFENLLYQTTKNINIDGQQINIKTDMREYYIYLCKERIDFFTTVDNVLKKIIDNNIITLKNIPLLLELMVTAYKNLKVDKEILNKEKDIIQSPPSDIIELLFKILIMLFINTNNIENENLLDEIMKVVDLSMILINIKPIKMSVQEKVEKKIIGLFR